MCSRKLQTLLIHWNSIRAPGAIMIAKQLKINNSLKVLDVSFNSFANGLTKRLTIKRPDPDKAKSNDELTG
jgi:Ran GTPase-activating protein (RanGAP) involved in mRNA processing and transport